MPWLFRSVALLLAIWLVYAASPYVALYDLADAVEKRDVARLIARANVPAIRVSLTRQLITGYVEDTAPDLGLGGRERQIAAAAIAEAVDPLVASLVTPEGILGLLRGEQAGASAGQATALARSTSGMKALWDLMMSSRPRGFRSVYFWVPPGEAPEGRFRLQLRFVRMQWRLIDVELPPSMRVRLARDVARRAGIQVPEPKLRPTE